MENLVRMKVMKAEYDTYVKRGTVRPIGDPKPFDFRDALVEAHAYTTRGWKVVEIWVRGYFPMK